MFITAPRASSGDRSPWGSFWFEPVSKMTGSGVRVSADSALAVTAVYACIRVKAESFAMLPFRLYRPKVGGGRQQVTDHWLARLFCRRPNAWQTPFEFREMLQAHIDLRGNAFCEISEDGAGGITDLLPLHPDRITLELIGESDYRYRYKMRNGAERILTRAQVWHIRGLSGDGYMGYNPIEIAREAIGEALQYQSYSSRFFANNATPPQWIKFPGKFADNAAKQTFREGMQAAQTGGNRGKTMVLDQGMELHQVAINQKDMQFIEARQMKVPEIARLWRMPPHKIGDLSKSAFSNIEQQAIEFWSDTMAPGCERWESSIECCLLGPDTDFEVEFDMRAQMRGDSAARAQYIHNMVLDGVLTRNEGRQMEGFDPIEGLDEPLVPVNERGLNDPDPAGEAGPGEDLPDATPTNPDDAGADARMAALVQGNAARLARRFTRAGATPPFDARLIADSLAVPLATAQAWLDAGHGPFTESELTAALVALGAFA
jgi:HK97 family phage portal protein